MPNIKLPAIATLPEILASLPTDSCVPAEIAPTVDKLFARIKPVTTAVFASSAPRILVVFVSELIVTDSDCVPKNKFPAADPPLPASII